MTFLERSHNGTPPKPDPKHITNPWHIPSWLGALAGLGAVIFGSVVVRMILVELWKFVP